MRSQTGVRAFRLFTISLAIALAFAASPAWAQARAKATPLGVAFVPRLLPSSSATDIAEAIEQAAVLGSHVSFMVSWRQSAQDLKALEVLTPHFRSSGLRLFLQFDVAAAGIVSPPAGLPATFTDERARERFLADIAAAARLEPDYLNLGAEVNVMRLLHPAEFDAFRTLYAEAYQQVKQISPATHVGVSYHMDLLLSSRDERGIVDALAPQDFVGITSYPAWVVYDGVYEAVARIPAAYYGRLRDVLGGRRVVIAEVGWPSRGRGTAADQSAFVARLPELLRDVRPELVSWALQHDVEHFRVDALTAEQAAAYAALRIDPSLLFEEFNSMGLRYWQGPAKAAWTAAMTLIF